MIGQDEQFYLDGSSDWLKIGHQWKGNKCIVHRSKGWETISFVRTAMIITP